MEWHVQKLQRLLKPFQKNPNKYSTSDYALNKNRNKHSDNHKSQKTDPNDWYDDTPLWMKNRKLLGRVFMVWLVLVALLLMSVFINISL